MTDPVETATGRGRWLRWWLLGGVLLLAGYCGVVIATHGPAGRGLVWAACQQLGGVSSRHGVDPGYPILWGSVVAHEATEQELLAKARYYAGRAVMSNPEWRTFQREVAALASPSAEPMAAHVAPLVGRCRAIPPPA